MVKEDVKEEFTGVTSQIKEIEEELARTKYNKHRGI